MCGQRPLHPVGPVQEFRVACFCLWRTKKAVKWLAFSIHQSRRGYEHQEHFDLV